MDQPIGTESSSNYDDLENKSLQEIQFAINKEDFSIATSVSNALIQIEALTLVALEKLKTGGRLFYIGAGTSGRLGVLDASEIPPTFGVNNVIIGLIAGGDIALRKAVEFAEDDSKQAWNDLQEYNISNADVLMGISASGETPYVFGGLKTANEMGIVTGCIVCNLNSSIAKESRFPIEVQTGPEFITGSTRMKAGTVQKMILNMISTSLMIGLKKVKGNKMVEMQLTNNKLINRGIKMLMQELKVDETIATALLEKFKNVNKAIENYNQK